jgi:hypothetical protein
MSKILTAVAVSVIAVSAFAGDAPKGDDGKRQEMFAKMKQIKVEGMQGRISILQTALSCVNAATSHDQMKPCEEKEHQAMEALNQQQKAKWDAMKPQK